jgi:hypothetical protein
MFEYINKMNSRFPSQIIEFKIEITTHVAGGTRL